MDNAKAVLAVLAGVAAGAALGVLLAPEKGADTRKKILKKGDDLARTVNDSIDEKFEALLDALTCRVKKATSQGEATASRGDTTA